MNREIEIMPHKPAIIHVNRHFIAANAKDGRNRPVYTIKYRGETIYAREFEVVGGRTKGVYNGVQLSCGARAWIEVSQGTLCLIDAQSFQEAKAA
jgi:hypothetical protein